MVGLDGRKIERIDSKDAVATVLFFAATDCPISNRYVPEVLRLQKKFESSHVRFWFVYPNPGDTLEKVRLHDTAFGVGTNALRDDDQAMVERARVTVTPEAAVFVPSPGGLREVYRGRIDDRYVSFSQERPQAMHHELEDALQAVIHHQAVKQPGGHPVGCAIQPLRP